MLIHFSIALLILNIKLCLSQSQCTTTYELNVDYKGEDLYAQPMFLTSAEACCSQCSNYTSCGAWTYVPDVQACWLKSYTYILRLISNGRLSGTKPGYYSSSSTSAITTTLLTPITFDSVTPPTTFGPVTPPTTTMSPVLSATSSVESKNYGCFIENDINYFGNDLNGTFVKSTADCCNLCGQTASCVVWSFLIDIKYCYLKNSLPSIELRLNYSGCIFKFMSFYM